MNNGNKLKLVLDRSVLDRYYAYYFEKYPKRKKRYIERPIHPSVNTWMIMQRPAMNKLKQEWHDFVLWWIEDLKLNDKQLDRFKLKFTTYMPTKRRCDPDNSVPKFILDGFSDSGFIQDDDGTHLKELSLATAYDKENPRTEIEVTVLE